MNGEPLDLDAIEAKFWYRMAGGEDKLAKAVIAECRTLRAEVERLTDEETPQRTLTRQPTMSDETLDGAGMVKPYAVSPSFDATVPSEAWDITHPDHDDWGDMVGWCYADECTRHDRKPGSTA